MDHLAHPTGVTSMVTELGLLDMEAASRLVDLRDRMVGVERWALFVGAGLSVAADLPNWNDLTIELASMFGVPCSDRPHDSAYPMILEECLAAAPSSDEFWRAVASKVCRGQPTPLHNMLLELPFEAFLTINFDCLLAQVHSELDRVSEPKQVSFLDPEFKQMNVSGGRLLHLHGRCHDRGGVPALDPDATVLTRTAYAKAYGPYSPLPPLLDYAAESYPWLMVGTSLGDWQIRHFLMKVQERQLSPTSREQLRGFAIVPSSNPDHSTVKARTEWPGSAVGVEPIFYVADSRHTALTNIARWLVDATAGAPLNRYEVS